MRKIVDLLLAFQISHYWREKDKYLFIKLPICQTRAFINAPPSVAANRRHDARRLCLLIAAESQPASRRSELAGPWPVPPGVKVAGREGGKNVIDASFSSNLKNKALWLTWQQPKGSIYRATSLRPSSVITVESAEASETVVN